MKSLTVAGLVLSGLALAGTSFAQMGRGGVHDGSGPAIDLSQLVTVDGVVVSFVAGLGQGMPELAVTSAAGESYTFVLGPFWYLTEQGFAARAGDSVAVTAYVCATCDTGYAVKSVNNISEGITLALRDAAGLPLWTRPSSGASQGNGGQLGTTAQGRGRQGSGGMGSGNGAQACDQLALDLTRTTTFTGTVVSFTLTAGDGAATLVLAAATGNVSILASPASILLRASFAPAAGSALSLSAAPTTVSGQEVWVALTITDTATGLQLVLRDPATGLPVTGPARHGKA
jgi:hypothetical protein